MKKIAWNKSRSALSLTAPGALRLFFVGVGSAFSKKHYQTNLLIIKDDDHILIDCGTRCPQALMELGLSVTDIKNILITHSHADHIGGLEECALIGRYFAKRKPRMFITADYEKALWEASLKGGIAYGEKIDDRWLEFSDVFEAVRPAPLPGFPREAWETHCGGIKLILFRTMHIPDSSRSWQDSAFSLGMIIDDRVLFTSDTRFDPRLVRELDERYQFEAIFHDCQFFTGGVHASIFELKDLPKPVKKRMYLSHFGDNFHEFTQKVKSFGFAGLTRQKTFYEF